MNSLANYAIENPPRRQRASCRGTLAGSAYSDTKALSAPAIAWMVDVGATGNIVIVELDGTSQTFDVSKIIQGSWILHKIKQIMATGTTLTNTSLRLDGEVLRCLRPAPFTQHAHRKVAPLLHGLPVRHAALWVDMPGGALLVGCLQRRLR